MKLLNVLLIIFSLVLVSCSSGEVADDDAKKQAMEKALNFKTVYFETSSSTLDQTNIDTIHEFATNWKDDPRDITLYSSSDIRGPASFNENLSQMRADSVKMELINSGVDGSRIKTVVVNPEEVKNQLGQNYSDKLGRKVVIK